MLLLWTACGCPSAADADDPGLPLPIGRRGRNTPLPPQARTILLPPAKNQARHQPGRHRGHMAGLGSRLGRFPERTPQSASNPPLPRPQRELCVHL